MKEMKKMTKKAGTLFASVALKTGIASSNAACRFGYYQNKVPDAMRKLNKQKVTLSKSSRCD